MPNLAFLNPAIEELKATEKTYNTSLNKLIKAFDKNPPSNPYLKDMLNIIRELKSDSDFLLIIFNKLCPYAVKKEAAKRNLLAGLTRRNLSIEDINQSNKPSEEEELRNTLEFQQVHFNLFLENYEKFSKLFARYQHEFMQEPDAFITIDTWLRTNTPNAQGLSDHISKPFQRGPRYKLVLTEIIKNPTHIDTNLLEAFKGLLDNCTTKLANFNKNFPNFNEEAGIQFVELMEYRHRLGLDRIMKPSEEIGQLISAIPLVVDELRNTELTDLSEISRRDLLLQINDMLKAPTQKKIENLRKTAMMLPGHAMTMKQTVGLSLAVLLLASAAAAALLVAGAPISLPTAAACALIASAAITFFGSRHQSGIAKATNQLVDKFEDYNPCPS